MWLILNKEFYDAELRDCRAVSAYEHLDNAKEDLKRLVNNLRQGKIFYFDYDSTGSI